MKKRSLLGLAAGTVALVLAGCAGSPSPDASTTAPPTSSEPIKFAVAWGISGAFSANAAAFMNGLNAGVDEINSAGGIDGRQIEVTPVDTKSDPTFAVTAVTELLNSGYKPDLLVPGGFSAEALAVLPTLVDKSIFSISSANAPATNDPAQYPYHFGLSYKQADALASVAKKMKSDGIDTVSVIFGADASGDAYLQGFQAAAKAAGVEIIATQRPDPKALNFDVDFQRALAAGADAIYGDISTLDATGRLFASRVTTGATDIPYYTGTAASSFNLQSIASADSLKGCFMPVFSSTVQQSNPPAYFDTWATAAAQDKNISAFVTGLGYDTVRIFALAAERSGGDLSAEALAKALTSEPVPSGDLVLYQYGTSYSPTDHFPSMPDKTFTTTPCGSTLVDGFWAP